jgi:tetratricopeptide (TPR) repeat protein
MKKAGGRRKRARKVPHEATLADVPFRQLIQEDTELRELREEYAKQPAGERRRAAEWASDSSQASMLFAQATGMHDMVHPAWHDAAAPLAIDPEYPAAMLTVGSLEYQFDRPEEAMYWFLRLTQLPTDTAELPEIIDRAGDFLIDQDDCINAEKLYAAAAAAHPEVAIYHVGWGYCAGRQGRKDESVAHHRRAVELEPDNYMHLNDLGYALMMSGCYD